MMLQNTIMSYYIAHMACVLEASFKLQHNSEQIIGFNWFNYPWNVLLGSLHMNIPAETGFLTAYLGRLE